jgi:serine/threonine protein kinase
MELLSAQPAPGDGRRNLSLRRAIELARAAPAFPAAAHEAGVIHGDVKPDNLIPVGEGDSERLVPVDFGLASLHAADAARSAARRPAAPEQLQVVSTCARICPRGRPHPARPWSASYVAAAELAVHRLVDRAAPMRRPLARHRPRVDDRFPSAAAFAASLSGAPVATTQPIAAPFRALTGYVEADEGAFFGRSETRNPVTQVPAPGVVLTARRGRQVVCRGRRSSPPQRLGFTTSYHRCRPTPAATGSRRQVTTTTSSSLFLAEWATPCRSPPVRSG